jgi:alpha-galactosidase
MNNLIHYLADSKMFFLQAQGVSYVIKILDTGFPLHVYWGELLEPRSFPVVVDQDRPFSPNPDAENRFFSLDVVPLEYPVYGTSDFRSPAIEVFQPKDGSRIVDLRYKSYRIEAGKPALSGLPSTRFLSQEDGQTLILVLEDSFLGLEVELLYSVFRNYSVITRSSRLTHRGNGMGLQIRRALSLSIDFSSSFSDYYFLQLSGAWARERDLVTSQLRPGLQSVDSKRGTSSHQQNPFVAICQYADDEERGRVYGFNLIYSGNFIASAEQDNHKSTRIQMGINPFDFSWKLDSGECFQTPEAVMVFSPEGLGGMSRCLHRFYRSHLLPSRWEGKRRPILVNNWEATYFDFNSEKLEKLATVGRDLGLELFVLDDGWFGKRNDDRTSLGDWVVNTEKLPGGLVDLGKKINDLGLQFGLWIEPEMISKSSNLYENHPDWCIHVPARYRTETRSQLVLDLSREDVRMEIKRVIGDILREVPINFVKWDMNRHLTEVGSAGLSPDRQQETWHRFVLGVYELMDHFTKEFPHILFEGCSGGGGRFDPGILHYMPQIWCSDNSDAISRLKIQYGTSLAYPLSTISAHVSASPNHQIGRLTSLGTRSAVAMTGAFGYELDLVSLHESEKHEIRKQITTYLEMGELMLEGDLYRLKSPFRGNQTAWMVVSSDQSEALVTWVTVLNLANPPQYYLPLRGLKTNQTYRLVGTKDVFEGDFLTHHGLPLRLPKGDFDVQIFHLKKA